MSAVILPASALQALGKLRLRICESTHGRHALASTETETNINAYISARLQVDYPMLFRLTNHASATRKVTHCGVMEFSAAEGVCYMPHWVSDDGLIRGWHHGICVVMILLLLLLLVVVIIAMVINGARDQ